MIEIKIPKEITDYKEKFLFGLTVRQLVSAVVALAICVPCSGGYPEWHIQGDVLPLLNGYGKSMGGKGVIYLESYH